MSTAIYDAEASIRARLVAGWDETAVPVKYPNVKYDPVIGTPFIDFRVIQTKNSQASLGGGNSNNLNRLWGSIYFKVCAVSDSGTKRMDEIIDLLTSLFKNKTFGSIVTYDVMFGTALSDVTGNWYTTALTIPFHYDYN